MSGIICSECGRDIDEIGQDNMSCTSEPLCEDCWNDQQSYAVNALRRGNKRLRSEVEALEEENEQLKAEIALIQPDAYMKLPVDADGVPIRIDDVVYGNPGVAWMVVGLRMSKFGWKVEMNDVPFLWKPDDLTHKKPEPPDSWEKLEEDVMKWSCSYFGIDQDAASCDDCPHGLKQTGNACWLNARLDMLARAKKLAGIEEGAQR